MPFKDLRDAEVRLTDSAKLKPEEVRDLMPYLPNLSVAAGKRLAAELALQNLEAVQQFERSSSRLTRWLIAFTGILVILTAALVYYSYALAQAEKNQSDRQSIQYTPRED
jgi:hypothetical protein